jgi:hypothetical protein
MHSTQIRLLLLCAFLLSLGTSCSGVPLRPDGLPGPQACPADALDAMSAWGISPGDTAYILIDENKYGQTPFTLSDGPVEGSLTQALGALPEETLLYGHIWAGSGPTVAIRYYEIRFPKGGRYPFCGVVLNTDGGLNKRPGSPPGVGIIQDVFGTVQAVDTFR